MMFKKVIYLIHNFFTAFPQMCLTAIANLRQESLKDGSSKAMFSKDREIIPYIDQYWEAMTTMPRRYITYTYLLF